MKTVKRFLRTIAKNALPKPRTLILALMLVSCIFILPVVEANAASSHTSASEYKTYINHTVFVKNTVNVYEEGNSASKVLGTVQKGSHITRIAYSTYGWSEVIYNGKVGFIASRYLTTDLPASGTIYTLFNTNFYSGPGSQGYTKLAVIPKGTAITRITMGSSGWSKVTYNGKTGYVANNYVATSASHRHNYKATEHAATCSKNAYADYICSCGSIYRANRSTTATGHSYKTWTVKPTTTSQGYDVYSCRNCSYWYHTNFKDKLTAAHTHNYVTTEVAATCTTDGYIKTTCACGSYSTRTNSSMTAKGHNYTVRTMMPTTSAQGYDLYTCSRCGYSFKTNYKDKLSGVGTADTTAIYNMLISFKSKYPEGTPFDNSVGYSWSCPYNGSVIFYADSGCAAFASELSHAAFGRKDFVKMYNITIADVRVGDILRINNNHSVIVLEVHADHVVIAEANYGGAVHWGRKLTASQVADATYLISRYADRLD